MATWLDTLLDTTGLRPAQVTWAAVLGVVAGGGTLIVSVVVVAVLFEWTGGVTWFPILAWTVAATQVTAAVLLITGGERLAVGAGRTRLVAGAALHLLVCAFYLVYALTVVARNTTEAPATTTLMTAIPLLFAGISAGSLFLALRPMTAEYLALCGKPARLRRF